jgi:hypothetical protein
MPTVTTWSNGRRAARFVKESKNSIKTTNSIPIYVTYFIVARIQDVTGATGIGFLMINNVDGQRQVRTNSTSFPVSVFFFTQTGGTNMVFGSFSQGQGFLFSGTVTSGSAIAYGNGVQSGTSGVNNSSPSRHYFGSGDGDNDYLSVDFAEILIYDSVLTTAQRQQVEGYLAHKWGLTPTYASNTPLTIPGCQLWLDAADSSTTTSITSGIWTDKSGNSYNTSYVSGGSGFTLGTINGLSAVTFPGGSNKVITTSVPTSTTTGFSIFFIASRSSSSGTNTRYIANLTSSLQIYTVSGTNTIASYVGATFPSTSLSISTGVPFILSLTVSSSTFSQWINGIANSSTGSTVSTSGSTIVIGGSGSYTTDLVFAGQIGEVIIFNTTLSTTQRQTVEGYLAKKWGLTVSGQFPSTHPYSKFPPP